MKSLLPLYTPYWIIALRFGMASLLMLMFFPRRIASMTRGDIRGGIVLGVVMFLGIIMQAVGLKYTTAGNQAFLASAYVLFVPLLLWAIKRRFPGRLTVGASCVCFTGMAILTDGMSGTINFGDALAVLSAVMSAVSIILVGKYAAECEIMSMSFLEFFITAVMAFCAGYAESGLPVIRLDEGLPALLFAGVFCSFICFLTQNIAQRYSTESHASIIFALEAVFGLIFGIVFLGEILTLRMAFGCFLILLSVLAVELVPVLH